MLDSGAVLQERYRIVRPLGEGGMGAVYRAWDLRLKIPVALKEMLPQPGLDPVKLEALREQFQQEAAVLARLGHPHLVRVTDYFEEQGSAYLVMDFVEGQSLATVIAQEGAQTEARVLTWARQILEALQYCHDRGVVHRDLKPQNIIIRADGSAVLVDFGLVKLWDPTDPRTRTVMRGMGTPEYAPPEQYSESGDHTGPHSDLYSLGATLYHALTGKIPPSATDRMAMPERFASLRQFAPAVSATTESAVMKALTLTVSDRWRTANEMLQALGAAQAPPPLPVASAASAVARTQIASAYPEPPSGVPSGPPPAPPSVPPSALPDPLAEPVRASAPPPKRQTKAWVWALGVVAALLCLGSVCVGAFLLFPNLFDRETVPALGPTWTPTSALVSTPVTDVDLPTPSTGFRITLVNNSTYAACYVYISPSESDRWGEDWLAQDETVIAGGRREFAVPAGNHDILVKACDGAVLASGWEIGSDTTLALGGGGLVPLRAINASQSELCYVYASFSDADVWGEDWLGAAETMTPDGVRVFFLEPGVYDLLAEDCSGQIVEELYGIDIRQEIEWVIGGP